MSIIKCPECGKEFSDKAVACPNCGCPTEEIKKAKENEFERPKANMKSNNSAQKKKRGCCGIILWAVIILAAIGWISGRNKNKETADSEKSEASNSYVANENVKGEETEATQKKEQEVSNPNVPTSYEEELSVFSSGEYLFISNEDLDKYCSNMGGAKVYVVTEVDDIKDGKIQSTLSEGFMMSNFNVGDRFSKYESSLSNGDVVAILGTVSGKDDYGFMGNSVDLQDCMVFATGSDAEQYRKDESDDGLSQYFVVTQEVADSNEVSEEEYKSLCAQLGYEDVLRNPDENEGTYCFVSGTVDQIIEGLFGGYTIYVLDSNGNKWECYYSYKDGESHLLDGDSVTFYGKCKGTSTSTTVLGEQVTLPYISAEYLN